MSNPFETNTPVDGGDVFDLSDLDLDSVEDNDFSPIPPGEYVVRLLSLENKSTQKGDKMLVWQMEVATGDHAKRQLFLRTVFTQKALFKLKQAVVAFGLWESGPLKLDPAKAVGALATAKVKRRNYVHNGEQKVGEEIERLSKFEGELPSDDIPF